MALAIYKPGQGYWTRLFTARGAAAIILAGVVWMWGQMDQMGTTLSVARETSRFIQPLQVKYPELKSIECIALIPNATQSPMVEITERGGAKTFKITPDELVHALRDAKDPVELAPGDLVGVSYSSSTGVTAGFQTFAARNRLYFKAVMAILTIVILGSLTFWINNKPSVVDFFIATEAEMKKVNWPTWKELRGSTLVVIAGMFLMTAAIFIIDVGFLLFFTTIRILPPLSGSFLKAIFGG